MSQISNQKLISPGTRIGGVIQGINGTCGASVSGWSFGALGIGGVFVRSSTMIPPIVEGYSSTSLLKRRGGCLYLAKTVFASVYPYYIKKVECKGRTKQELHQVIAWLTGFDDIKLQALIDGKATFETFFQQAKLNPNAYLITGVICGYRIEEIENPLTKQVRYLDKLIDELAQGKKMEKILRMAAANYSD